MPHFQFARMKRFMHSYVGNSFVLFFGSQIESLLLFVDVVLCEEVDSSSISQQYSFFFFFETN